MTTLTVLKRDREQEQEREEERENEYKKRQCFQCDYHFAMYNLYNDKIELWFTLHE